MGESASEMIELGLPHGADSAGTGAAGKPTTVPRLASLCVCVCTTGVRLANDRVRAGALVERFGAAAKEEGKKSRMWHTNSALSLSLFHERSRSIILLCGADSIEFVPNDEKPMSDPLRQCV